MAGENEVRGAGAAAESASEVAPDAVSAEPANAAGSSDAAESGASVSAGASPLNVSEPDGEEAPCADDQAVYLDAEQATDTAEAHEPTAEERELAENNALADVFDDVRKQSADSSLVTPDRWVEQGFVPDHMTADEFEMLVYEYLENYRRDHKEEIEEEKRERAAKRSSVRSATHAVGVPPKIPNRRLAEIEADEEAKAKTAADGAEEGDPKASETEVLKAETASASEPVEQLGESPVQDAPAEAAAPEEAVPATAADDSDDSDDPFAGLKIPDGYKLVELEGEYVLVPDEDAKPVRKEIHCEHIVTLVGQHSYYLYDSDLMTKNYAHWSFLSAEDNPLATFVDCVREEGRVYPRPLSESDLANEPFRMSASKVEETWAKLVESGDYPDIERCEASNGDVYYFSTLYMTRVLAESLAEYESVERKANV